MARWDWASTKPEPKWSFVVDTEDYAGNFERELSSYVVGQCDEHGDHRGGPYREMFEKEVLGRGSRGHFEKEDPFEDLVATRVDDHGDDHIAHAPMALAPTPGYSNDGSGNVKKLKPGQKAKWPAFNSVAIFLTRRPTEGELKILVRRAKAFAALPKTKDWDCRPKILGFRLVEERMEIVSHEISE